VVTNRRKTATRPDRRQLLLGTRRLYDFVDNNRCSSSSIDQVATAGGGANARMVSITAAFRDGFDGQVCVTSSKRFYGGVSTQGVHPGRGAIAAASRSSA